MEIKELVPDSKLCKLIPKGEFGDSACIYVFDPYYDDWDLALRKDEDPLADAIPAPTLEEITKELGQFMVSCFDSGYSIEITTGWDCVSADSAVDGAMKLWFKTKGIKYEKD